ncbi:MAG: YkgJ family cysteine cluster protein [Desulfobacterales bacterium]
MELPEGRLSPKKDCVFLAPDEVVSAIREDFDQYPPQPTLFLNLCPLVLGPGQVVDDAKRRGAWTIAESRGRMQLIEYRALGERICRALEQQPPGLERLAVICRMVFHTRAIPGQVHGAGGIFIDTGMEGFRCVQCGQCCIAIGYPKEAGEADVARWKKAGRDDILKWVGLKRRQGSTTAYRIWIEPGANRPAQRCPWLMRQPGTHRYQCAIHEVKPDICRLYPGSRKHAVMTGCRGFDNET